MEVLRPHTLILAFVLTLAVGTLGYEIIEGWDWFDGLYMTVISVTTVGYQELKPLSTAGRAFTMVLILAGIGIAFLALSALASAVLRGEIYKMLGRKKMQAEIKKLENHYIVAGFGRMGTVIVNQFRAKKMPCVVIDEQPESEAILRELGVPHISGDATDEKVLEAAGIRKAKAFISVISGDPDNAFAIMTAKGMNPDLRVVTRCVLPQSMPILRAAGAHKVISPYVLGGARIAQAVLNPAVVDFVEFVEEPGQKEIEMAEVEIREGSKLLGQSLGSELMKSFNIIVVAIRKGDGKFTFHPKGHTTLEVHDKLVFVGQTENVQRATQLA